MHGKILYLEGVPLLVPDCVQVFPFTTFKDCPSSCGAGDGLGEKLVPDTMWGLRVSPACWIHDLDWNIAPPTWEAFHVANSRFIHNLITIVEYRSESDFLKRLRVYRCATYYNFVDVKHNHVFWKQKQEQQDSGQWPDFSPISDVIKDLQINLIGGNRQPITT